MATPLRVLIVEDRSSDLALVAEEGRSLVAENVRSRISKEVPNARYEFRGLRKDGTIIDSEVLGNRTELHGRPAVINSLVGTGTTIHAQFPMAVSNGSFVP